MKHRSLLVIVTLLCLSLGASAQYRHSIGGIAGSYWGVSYKTNISSVFGVSADLAVKLTEGAFSNYSASIYTLELNPNAMWQPTVGPGKILVGGGISLGYGFQANGRRVDFGKFGVNALAGYEYVFSNIPLALQFDFRPGLGIAFDDNVDEEYFDWGLGISARYTF